MEKNLLKSARVKKGLTQSDLASKIEKSTDAYAKKERGETFFTPAEIAIISATLELTFQEFNDIFFAAKLQFGKNEAVSHSSITV